MTVYSEPPPECDQDCRTPFAPRCTRDIIKDQLFQRRRDRRPDLAHMVVGVMIYSQGLPPCCEM